MPSLFVPGQAGPLVGLALALARLRVADFKLLLVATATATTTVTIKVGTPDKGDESRDLNRVCDSSHGYVCLYCL